MGKLKQGASWQNIFNEKASGTSSLSHLSHYGYLCASSCCRDVNTETYCLLISRELLAHRMWERERDTRSTQTTETTATEICWPLHLSSTTHSLLEGFIYFQCFAFLFQASQHYNKHPYSQSDHWGCGAGCFYSKSPPSSSNANKNWNENISHKDHWDD